jgi:hypothetical protein
MNYIDKVARFIGKHCGMDASKPEDLRLLRIYAVLALTIGEETTEKHVHDAWSAWCCGLEVKASEHRSLIPFEELPREIQILDEPYAVAIRLAAWQLGLKSTVSDQSPTDRYYPSSDS